MKIVGNIFTLAPCDNTFTLCEIVLSVLNDSQMTENDHLSRRKPMQHRKAIITNEAPRFFVFSASNHLRPLIRLFFVLSASCAKSNNFALRQIVIVRFNADFTLRKSAPALKRYRIVRVIMINPLSIRKVHCVYTYTIAKVHKLRQATTYIYIDIYVIVYL
jgi:hypothetical protein